LLKDFIQLSPAISLCSLFLVQHIEFFHIDHFEKKYYRIAPPAELSHFIDFFWETRFESLWNSYPNGFSDAQFSNIGYTSGNAICYAGQ